MRFTYKTKQTMKQFTRLALPAALLAMAVTPSYGYDFTGLHVSDFATPEQATASLKQAGFDINQMKAFEKLAGGEPATLVFPYTNKAGQTVNKEYTFKNIADLKAQAKTIALDYQKLTRSGGTFDLKAINGTVKTFNGQTVEFSTAPDQVGAKGEFAITKSSVPGIPVGTFKDLGSFKVDQKAVFDSMNNTGLGNKAGTPASHVAQMTYYDSILDNNGVAAGNVSGDVAAYKSGMNTSFRFNNYTLASGGASAQLYTVSLGYNLELGNGMGLLLNMPLTYVNTDTGTNTNSSYRVSMGAGVRLPVSQYLRMGALKWDVIPLVRVGGVGFGSTGPDNTSIAYSGGVQSNMGGSLGNGFALILQNQYTYNTDASMANNNIAYKDINVHVYRNGLQINKETGVNLFGKPLTAGFSFADVRYDSNKLSSIDNQQEFGFNFGLKGNGAAANLLKLNVTYTNADGYNDAVAVSVGGTY
jgi:hypothetical protein